MTTKLYPMSEQESAQIDNWFTHHAPVGNQGERYSAIRKAGGEFARTILELCPPSADRTVAIRMVREATFTANASIACNE